MNTPTPRGTPSLTLPSTQNTAPVLEFGCLYTLDIRRKAKRWHDGFLRFHTFNKRIMVYDMPRNFIGDVHWRESGDLQDGDEITLEKGVLVQVGEPVGRSEQDLTGLWEKKVKDREERVKKGSVTPRSPAATSSASISAQAQSPTPRNLPLLPAQLRPRSLNSLLGLTRRSSGRVEAPVRTPFEERYGIQPEEGSHKRQKTVAEPSSASAVTRQPQPPSSKASERSLKRSFTEPEPTNRNNEIIIIPDDEADLRHRRSQSNRPDRRRKEGHSTRDIQKPTNDATIDETRRDHGRPSSSVAHLPSKPLRISSSSSRKRLMFQETQSSSIPAISSSTKPPVQPHKPDIPTYPADALGKFQQEQQTRIAARLSRKSNHDIDPFQEIGSTQLFEDIAQSSAIEHSSSSSYPDLDPDPDSLFLPERPPPERPQINRSKQSPAALQSPTLQVQPEKPPPQPLQKRKSSNKDSPSSLLELRSIDVDGDSAGVRKGISSNESTPNSNPISENKPNTLAPSVTNPTTSSGRSKVQSSLSPLHLDSNQHHVFPNIHSGKPILTGPAHRSDPSAKPVSEHVAPVIANGLTKSGQKSRPEAGLKSSIAASTSVALPAPLPDPAPTHPPPPPGPPSSPPAKQTTEPNARSNFNTTQTQKPVQAPTSEDKPPHIPNEPSEVVVENVRQPPRLHQHLFQKRHLQQQQRHEQHEEHEEHQGNKEQGCYKQGTFTWEQTGPWTREAFDLFDWRPPGFCG
ncbi:hypothetical protein L228DRAFT_247451 [Xylona heveae TC161]|uniref:5'-3' DNA helicase ZGRF1-like N-terminal domain-containing protein n=1 Tax=Xylona heveae (strain CBS 132557 / TC161) TaxID=1328760 RepID=A0A165H5F7_XYLHT|nr:hypothetical protein L228DRAFT_247451 [Xylona heveae TC161]KZF23010.1 hypothetical protein L228DRAFT_247451 [Xylona heveae TC161]